MNKQHIPVERCRESRTLSVRVFPLLAQQAPPFPRHALSAAAINLAHEHHSSVIELIESSHFASAAAMLRPMMEAVATALWSLYVAPVEHVEGLFWGRRQLPKPSAMISAIEACPELKGKLGIKLFMDGPGQVLHKFTHGDMDQLLRRFNNTGASYTLHKNTGFLFATDMFLLLAATVHGAMSRSKELEGFLKFSTDQMVDEIRRATGDPLQDWPGWKPLPDPGIPLGEIPIELREA